MSNEAIRAQERATAEVEALCLSTYNIAAQFDQQLLDGMERFRMGLNERKERLMAQCEADIKQIDELEIQVQNIINQASGAMVDIMKAVGSDGKGPEDAGENANES